MSKFDEYMRAAGTCGEEAMSATFDDGAGPARTDLLILAQLNATLAQAAALDRIATSLDAIAPAFEGGVPNA